MHEITEKVANLELTPGKYVVTGGARLAVLGLRKNSDIDLLLLTEMYEELKNRGGWNEEIMKGPCYDFSVLRRDEFEAFTLLGFHSRHFNCDVSYEPNVKKIIETADFIDEIPFINLNELISFKTAHGREKDKRDLDLINQYLESKNRKEEEIAVV